MQPELHGRPRSTNDKSNSPTSVPLPLSPHSNDNFDALIDLLASDEAPKNTLTGNHNGRVQPGGQPHLRDAVGQLDFAKIRSMFESSSNGNPDRNPQRFTSSESAAIPESSRIKANVPLASANKRESSTHISPIRTSAISTLNLSTAPRTIENSDFFDAGLPPAESTPIPAVRALRGDNTTGTSSGIASNTQPELAFDKLADDSESSLLALRNALDRAQLEIMDLRQRCRELEDLPSTSEITTSKDDLEKVVLNPPISSVPKSQDPDVNESYKSSRSNPTSDDIHRALELVKFVDELVWKRSRFGARYEYPYSSENIQALQERLELWEQAVRTRR